MSSITSICFICLIMFLTMFLVRDKYILTGINVASRYKVARPLRTKKSSEVAFVLEAIYKKGSVFKYPKIFQCDNGLEFKVK